MKRLFLITLFIPFIGTSQVTLTQQIHEPTNGSMIYYCQVADSVTIIPRSSGTGQLWDFSKVLIANSSCFPTTYTASGNFLESTEGRFSSANSTWSYYGFPVQYYKYTYFDPQTVKQWPFSFGSSLTDSFTASYSEPKSGGVTKSVYLTGTVVVSATGTGTLIGALGQLFNNVLQVTTTKYLIHDNKNSVSGHMWFVTDTIVEREYYIANQMFPLVKESSGKSVISNPQLPYAHSYPITVLIAANLTSVGVKEMVLNNNLRLFPSPCDHVLNLQLEDQNVSKLVRILDGKGMIVQEMTLEPDIFKYQINTSSLSTGIYFMLIDGPDGNYCEKFSVAR